jgi:hypothetical protein
LYKPKSIRSYFAWLLATVLIFCAIGFEDAVIGSAQQEIARTEWVSIPSHKKVQSTIFIGAKPESFSPHRTLSFYQAERSFSSHIITSLKVHSQRMVSYDSFISIFHSFSSASEEDLLIPRG